MIFILIVVIYRLKVKQQLLTSIKRLQFRSEEIPKKEAYQA